MTDAAWVADLLNHAWQEDFEGRSFPVSKPTIIEEGNENRRSYQFDTQDLVFTLDGGLPQIEPQSLGYSEKRVESTIDIEITTSEGRERVVGEAGFTYDGIAGEIERIIDEYRLGVPDDDDIRDPGYDVIIPDTFDDEIGDRPAGEWGGTWKITFITYADTISQSPANR